MSHSQNIPVLHVGILTQPVIRFRLDGTFHAEGIPAIVSGEYSAHVSGNTIEIVHNGTILGKVNECTLSPSDDECSFWLRDVTIGVQFHWERNEDQRFSGSLRLIRDGDRLTAINSVNIEEYLTSVISSEMSAECSLDLLKAHTVTARSWLLAQLEKSRSLKSGGKAYETHSETDNERIRWYDREDHAQFDVCADDHCQRYQGITKAYTGNVKHAVDATTGDVLFHDGRICDARFSKSCGGVTELFENTWEPVTHPYLADVVDSASRTATLPRDFSREENAEKWIRSSPEAFCNTSEAAILRKILPGFDQETADFFRWKVEYEQEELAHIIRQRSGIDFGNILDLIPVQRGTSSRLVTLKIIGTQKTMIIGKELEIRRTLSPSHLYSSAIIIEKQSVQNGIPERFVILGAGWGHGVGLCQIGAAVMGEQGYAYDKILAHYFPHTTIEKIY